MVALVMQSYKALTTREVVTIVVNTIGTNCLCKSWNAVY